MSCPFILRTEDEDVLCRLPSSATAAEGGRHRGDSGLEEKSIQAIYSRSQLDGQRALCLSEPLMKLQNVRPRGALASNPPANVAGESIGGHWEFVSPPVSGRFSPPVPLVPPILLVLPALPALPAMPTLPSSLGIPAPSVLPSFSSPAELFDYNDLSQFLPTGESTAIACLSDVFPFRPRR